MSFRAWDIESDRSRTSNKVGQLNNNGQKINRMKKKKIIETWIGGSQLQLQLNPMISRNQQQQQNQQQKQLQQHQQHQQEQQQQINGQKIINCQSSGNSGMLQLEHEKLVSTQLQHLGNERSLQICQSSGKLANEQYSLLPVSNQLQNLHSIAENPTYGCLTSSRDQQHQQQQEQHWNHSPIQIGHSSGSDLALPTQHPCDDSSNCQALAVSTIGPQSKRRPFVELLGIILFLLGPQIAQSNDNCGNGGGMPPSGNNNNHSNNDNNKKKQKHWQRVATPNSASLQRSADLLDNGQNDGNTSSFTSYRMLEHVAAPAVAADCGRMAAAAEAWHGCNPASLHPFNGHQHHHHHQHQ
ncbi:hypothetical protein ACLKA6_007334 [Drosophila palustris]